MILDSCDIPVVLAPLAGGPSTPELAAAVSNAGGLGFLAAGYLPAVELAERRRRLAGLTSRPFGVNVFVPGPAGDVARVRRFAADLAAVAALRVEPDEAADIIWATNAPELYQLLVGQRGWSPGRYEHFLADTWRRLLLADGQ